MRVGHKDLLVYLGLGTEWHIALLAYLWLGGVGSILGCEESVV